MTAPNLEDVFAAGQAVLEGKVAKALVTSPAEVLKLCGDWLPEINVSAQKFFKCLEPYREELQHANFDGQRAIVNRILTNSNLWMEFLLWEDYAEFEDGEQKELAPAAAVEALRDITALHHSRWGIRVLRNTGLLHTLFAGRCS